MATQKSNSTGIIGAGLDRVTKVPEFAPGTTGIFAKNTAVYVKGSGALAANARVNVDGSYVATANASGTHAVQAAMADGEFGWVALYTPVL